MAINIIGYGPKTLANPSTPVNLPSGSSYVLPSGQYQVIPGLYTFVQWYDPVTLTWRGLGTPVQSDPQVISSDGSNYRLFNGTGTMVGSVITNAGTGYTNGIYAPVAQLGTAAAPSVVMSAGGGSILARPTIVVGGAINTTVVITAGGTAYTVAPTLVVSNPPAGGVPATATCTISAGVINAVTVTNQGAGYTSAPTITIINGTGDVTGSGSVLTVNATLVGSGTVTALTMQTGSTGVGMTTVPTYTFAPASTTAATAIMCFTVTTAIAQTGKTNSAGNIGFLGSTVTAGSATLTNPAISTGIFAPRVGSTAWSTTASGGLVVIDGGLHQTAVAGIAYADIGNGTVSGATTAVAQTMGGSTDLSYIVQI